MHEKGWHCASRGGEGQGCMLAHTTRPSGLPGLCHQGKQWVGSRPWLLVVKLATAHVPPVAPSFLFYPHPLLSRRNACQHSRPCEVTSSWLPGVWGHLPVVLCGCQEPIHSSWLLPGKNRRHCPSLTAVRNEVLRREEGGKPSLGNTMGNLSVLLGHWRAPPIGADLFPFP